MYILKYLKEYIRRNKIWHISQQVVIIIAKNVHRINVDGVVSGIAQLPQQQKPQIHIIIQQLSRTRVQIRRNIYDY